MRTEGTVRGDDGEPSTLRAACQATAHALLELGYALPSVYLLLDGRLRCVEAIGYYQVVDGHPPGVGVVGGVVQAGRPRVIENVHSAPEFIAARPDVVAEACVPILLGGAVLGAVNVESVEALPGGVLNDLISAAARLSDWIGAHGGLPTPPLAQRLARVAVELTSLSVAADIVERTVTAATELSGMSSAALVRAGRGGWSVVAAAGPLAPSMKAWSGEHILTITDSVEAGTSSHVARGAIRPPAYDFLEQAGVAVFNAQPITVSGAVTGVLITADERHGVFERDDAATEREAVLELLAAQTAAALSMAKAVEDLRLLAISDSLTKLPNAAAFAADLEAAARAASSGRAPQQACLMIDIDNFKAVNDTFGHLAGDELLTALTAALGRSLRASDRLYRIGGDEFAALVLVTADQDGLSVGLRLVEAARLARATVSVGSSVVGPDARAVRVQADTALYLAKQAGRDTAVVYPAH